MSDRLLLASVTADAAAARQLRERALQTLQAVKSNWADPRLLALQVEGFLSLDQKADAQPLIKQLWNDGYRDPEFVDVLKRARIDYPPNPAFQAKLAAAEAQIHADAVPPAGHKGNK